MSNTFTPEQIRYLTDERRLGRIATIQPDGTPHLVPLGWTFNIELGTIDISGRNFETTHKFRNVQTNDKVAFLVDDVLPPWRPRAVMIQGHAEAISTGGGMLRITPIRIISWGLGET